MANGVQILLERGTRLPWWLKRCRGVRIRMDRVVGPDLISVSGRPVRVVTIRGGAACFFLGGSVLVERMPGYRGSGFQLISTDQGLAGKALQIRDLDGKVLEQNHYLCERCFRTTGKVVERKAARVVGREDAVIECRECGARWERRI